MTEFAMAQRMDALSRGNEVRLARAGMKRRIASEGRPGAATAARVLLRNPPIIRSMDVGEFLLWVRYFDKPRVRKMLERKRISPWCPIDELTERHRRLLVEDLEAFAHGVRS